MMNRILIASILTACSISSYAAETQAADTVFKQAEQLYTSKNYSAAFQEMQRLSQTGNAQATYNLGYMSQMGEGTPRDMKKAVSYYQTASDKGFAKASLTLAHAYRDGSLGLVKNTEEYKKFLKKALEQGSDDAVVETATMLFSQNNLNADKAGLQILMPLVQKNYYPAVQVKAYYDMSLGVKNKNPLMLNQGIQALQSIAQKGYAPAAMALATMMANGDVIPQNLPEAQKVFTELAKQNVPNAQESLNHVNQLIEAKQKTDSKK